MIIVQISDTHIDLSDPDRAARLGDLERCVAAINRLDPLPDVAIHTGDLTHNGTAAEYDAVKRILSALACPVYVAVGNRDNRAELRAAFPIEDELLPGAGFVQYAVDRFLVRLVVLDTRSATGNQGDFCQARADSLRAALAEPTDKPTAIFLHHPPFVVRESDYPQQFKPWDSVERMEGAINGHDQVVALFCGHSHRQSAGTVAGVPVSSMPSVAVDLRLDAPKSDNRPAPVFKLHRLNGQGRFDSETRAA